MNITKTVASGVLAALLASTAASAATELTVYTAVEAVDLERYKQTFEARTRTSRSTGCATRPAS